MLRFSCDTCLSRRGSSWKSSIGSSSGEKENARAKRHLCPDSAGGTAYTNSAAALAPEPTHALGTFPSVSLVANRVSKPRLGSVRNSSTFALGTARSPLLRSQQRIRYVSPATSEVVYAPTLVIGLSVMSGECQWTMFENGRTPSSASYERI